MQSAHGKYENKYHYIGYLRAIAIVAVVTIHVTSEYYSKYISIDQATWWLSNVLNSASRFCVPMFVMISGAVLLGKQESIVYFYKKRAARLLPPLVFWNIFFIFFKYVSGGSMSSLVWELKGGWFIEGRTYFHLWYLSMFVCLMLFAPFINQFINGTKPDKSDLKILLSISFAFFVLHSVARYLTHTSGLKVNWFTDFHWYIAYFVGGYYLERYSSVFPPRKYTLFLIIVTLTGIGAWLNYNSASSMGVVDDSFVFDNTGPLVFLVTGLIFVLAKMTLSNSSDSGVINNLSEASFGIYLIHPVFIKALKDFFNAENFNLLASIPLVIFSTLTLSYLVITTIRKVRIFRKLC